MFESDDFDQVKISLNVLKSRAILNAILSQLDIPEPCVEIEKVNTGKQGTTEKSYVGGNDSATYSSKHIENFTDNCKENIVENIVTTISNLSRNPTEDIIQTSPKHNKRKLINSYFDKNVKRKFPGPAGLLNGCLEVSKEDDMCQVELLSQDVDYAHPYLHKEFFESPLWLRLMQDTKDMKVDSIKNIKQKALRGNLRCRKAEAITAYVENVDRSAIDPLIILRDVSENIKCTLHRDAWVAFSPYLVSECCALVLCYPTVLTTGSAFKKHYLNITISNIYSVYSSAVIKQDESFPVGFKKIYEEDYTVIINEKQSTGNNYGSEFHEESDLLDGLDGAFSNDIFS